MNGDGMGNRSTTGVLVLLKQCPLPPFARSHIAEAAIDARFLRLAGENKKSPRLLVWFLKRFLSETVRVPVNVR